MTSPRTATAATLSSLFLAAVLNVEALTAHVALQPDSPMQQAALQVLQPVESKARDCGLTRPRQWLRAVIGREPLLDVAGLEHRAPAPHADVADTGDAPTTSAELRSWAQSEPDPDPSPPSPMEVWVIGDSLINMGGPRLATLLEERLQAKVWVDSRPNTGLVRPDYYDWPAALTARLATEMPPHVVVVLMGANDGQNMRVDGARTERWSEPWRVEYARRVGHVMDLLTQSGARVAWLGLPGMRRRTHQRTADLLNTLLAEEATPRESVVFIPLEARFTYRERRFSVHLERADGQRFTARAGDGVHFTWSGSRVLADHVFSALEGTWPDWFASQAPALAADDEAARK